MPLQRFQTGPRPWTGRAVISTGAQLTPKPRRYSVMRWPYAKRRLGPEHRYTNLTRFNLSRLLFLIGSPTEAPLDAVGRTEEAKALREKYGLTEREKPNPS
jgi:hypothetical protein